ncbi:MAG: hypothetical protein AAGA33_03400 [Pseudomonadota bacterium]
MVLSKDSFDPEAVYMDDIVDDEVLPYLSLAVDGLTEEAKVRDSLELRPEDLAANEVIKPDTVFPDAPLDPDHLEVVGWESSFLRKIRGYIGL